MERCQRGNFEGAMAGAYIDRFARCEPAASVGGDHAVAGKNRSTLFIFLAKVHPDPRPPPCICVPGLAVQTFGVLSHPARDHGPCTAEAAPYLRGISSLYDRLRPGDTAVFAHFHLPTGPVPWHAPRDAQQYQDVLRMLFTTPQGRAYRASVTYGGLYCWWTDRFTQLGLKHPADSLRGALQLRIGARRHRLAAVATRRPAR
jgi:hypothetical protein